MKHPALMGLKRLHGLLLISVSFLASFSLLVAQASVAGEPTLEGEARARLAEAFEAVSEAENMGGDVSQLVEELNQAIALLEEGKANGDEAMLRGAILKAEDVIAMAPAVGRDEAAAAQARMVQGGVTIGLVAISAVIVWRYGPRLFWRLWVRSKKNWRVKACL